MRYIRSRVLFGLITVVFGCVVCVCGWCEDDKDYSQKGTKAVSVGYRSADFLPEEGWRLYGDGDLGGSRMEGNRLWLDFSSGAGRLWIEGDVEIPGVPKILRWSVRGKVPKMSLVVGSAGREWIMDFPYSTDEDRLVVAPMDNLDRWRQVGEGHGDVAAGPLRLCRIEFHPTDGVAKTDLELGPILIDVEYEESNPLFPSVEGYLVNGTARFVLTIRCLSENVDRVDVSFSAEDFSGSRIHSATGVVDLSAKGKPGRIVFEVNVGDEPYVEGRFALTGPGGVRGEVDSVLCDRPSGVDESFTEWIENEKLPAVETLGLRREAGLFASALLYSRAMGWKEIDWEKCREAGVFPLNSALDFSKPIRDLRDRPAYRALYSVYSLLSGTNTPADDSSMDAVKVFIFKGERTNITAYVSPKGSSGLYIRSASTEVELTDLMGRVEKVSDVAEKHLFSLEQGMPLFITARDGNSFTYEVFGASTDKEQVRRGESIAIRTSFSSEMREKISSIEPMVPDDWSVERRSGSFEGDLFMMSVGVPVPDGVPIGKYDLGFALKDGEGLVIVDTEVHVTD